MNAIISTLSGFFAARSVTAYLVGGYLRDSLLRTAGKDIDIAIAGAPLVLGRELADLLGGAFVVLDQGRSIARVVAPGDGGEAMTIDLSPLHGTITEDLAQRDFTVDAMALPLGDFGAPDWKELVVDPFGGRSDLAAGLLRAVGAEVFREDPARLLRAVRVAAHLSFTIERITVEQIRSQAPLLSQVSGERMRDEFLAILQLKEAQDQLYKLDQLGLLGRIIPELEEARGVSQPKEHYWNVFDHSLHTVGFTEEVLDGSDGAVLPGTSGALGWQEQVKGHFAEKVSDGHGRCTMMKVAALLHDIAKPQTKTVDETGRVRFLGHSTLGADMARARLRALRFSARGVDNVCTMVEHHLRPTQMSQGVEYPTPRAVYRYFRDLGDVAVDTLYLSLADYLAARGPNLDTEDWRQRVAVVQHILEAGLGDRAVRPPLRLVTGHDLMDLLGLKAGPHLGHLLDDVHEAQAVGEVTTREEALAWVKARLEEESVKGVSDA